MGCNENNAAVTTTCRIVLPLHWTDCPEHFTQPNATNDQSLSHSFCLKYVLAGVSVPGFLEPENPGFGVIFETQKPGYFLVRNSSFIT